MLPQRNCLSPLVRIFWLHTIKMEHHVFVYGTLKQGEPNHNWLTDAKNGKSKFKCKAVTKTKYPLVIATRYNIPFLLYKPNVGHHVKGEIYEVDDAMLSKLDILEDHPKYYERSIDAMKPLTENTSNVNCWVYFLKNFKDHVLELPMLEDYSSKGPHGLEYMERSKRDPNYKYIDELR